MNNLTVWKRVYPIIASKSPHPRDDVVEEVMEICKLNITDVLLMYKPYSRDGFIKWKDTYEVKEIVNDDEMCNFIHTLSKRMNLDTSQSWDMICNFLVYEYYGRREELKSIIRYNSKIDLLVERVWHFYTLDRMFLLKTLQHILENFNRESDIYYKKLQSLVNGINLSTLWKTLVKVFHTLTEEISKDDVHLVTPDILPNWIHRNNREQIEVVFLLIDLLPYYKLQKGDFEQVLSLCIRHGFGRIPMYPDALKVSRKDDLLEVKYAETVLVLALFEKVWKTPDLWKRFEQPLEGTLDFLKIQGFNDIIFYIWSLFKITTRENNPIEKRSICADMEDVLKKNPFKALYVLMKHNLFVDTKAADVMSSAVYYLLKRCAAFYNNYHTLYEQEGIGQIFALLLQMRGLEVLETLEPIYQSAMDCFPLVFEPFLEICKSLLAIPEKYESTLRLLKNLPTLLSEIPWQQHSDATITTNELQLFVDSNLFIVPAGVLAKKFKYRTYQCAQLHFPFSFFLLLEQYIKSLNAIAFELGSHIHQYSNLKQVVLSGYQFVHYFLKSYEGEYRKDIELRTLVSRLNIIPIQFCEGPKMCFELVLLYFAVNSTLIKRGFLDYMEAFPIEHRKKFMPSIHHYTKENKDTLIWQLEAKSYLFKALREEEGKNTHELMVEYLEFLYYMVKEDRYPLEVQLPGLWFIIHSAFPFHQQWNYENRCQKVAIGKLCCSILVHILQKQLLVQNRESDITFDYVLDSFFTNDTIVLSLLAVITKERFHLQEAMMQESKWKDGPGDEYLEYLRLHVVLAFLLYKHKAGIEHKRNFLDNQVGSFVKAVISYIVNPFSLPLKMLSCKFLELIAKDKFVPLLAMLGLDNEQVQRLFLDRLRDPTEDDGFKCLLLDLIGTCLFHQNGMTASFFNFKRVKKWYNDSKDDEIAKGVCVTDFMLESLWNMKTTTSLKILKSPLQIGILHIMANLWANHKMHLVSEAIKLPEFWPLLSYPLFKEFIQSFRVYGYIFKIFAIHLVESLDCKQPDDSKAQSELYITDKELFKCVERFIKTKHQVEKWITFFIATFENCSRNIEDVEERHYFLKSWMEFFVVLEHKEELTKMDQANKYYFLCKALDAVQFPMVNLHCLKLWMQLLLLQFTYWKESEVEDVSVVARKAVNAVSTMTNRYKFETPSVRKSILAVIHKILQVLRKHFESSSFNLNQILEYLGQVIEIEYQVVEEYRWDSEHLEFDVTVREPLLPWMQCVTTVNYILEFENISEAAYWFSYRRFIAKYTYASTEFMKHRASIPLAKVMIHGLVLYANSKMAMDFLNFDFNKFYIALEKPVFRLLYGENNKINPILLEEAWTTCSSIIHLITACCKNLQEFAITKVYSFLIVAEKLLDHIFGVVETTVALKALDLVISTLMFFDTLQQNWSTHWYKKSNDTYTFVMTGIKKVINGCLYAILRPKNIMVYVLDNMNRLGVVEKFPLELMVAIVNRLVTAVGIGCSILYKVNTGLLDLLAQVDQYKVMILIENDFSVPKFELPVTNNLTYGMLLCLAHFMCKTLEAIRLQGVPEDLGGSEATPVRYFSRVFGMVEHQGFSDSYPTQKLSAFLRYAMYEYTGLADPWTLKLNYNRVKTSLEHLMMFLAQQIFLAINTAPFDNDNFFKRNLSSELQFFYEHVKKITSLMLTEHSVATPVMGQFEFDVLKKFLFVHKEMGTYDKIVDTNFCIILSYWFINMCKLK